MAALAGYGGSAKIGAQLVANIGEWDLTADTNMLDVTYFGDQWKDQLAGIHMWSGQLVGRLDASDTQGQIALQNAYLNGTTVSLSLTGNGTNNYTGTAYIKTLNIKTPASGSVDVTFSIEGTGPLTYA